MRPEQETLGLQSKLLTVVVLRSHVLTLFICELVHYEKNALYVLIEISHISPFVPLTFGKYKERARRASSLSVLGRENQ